MKLFVGVAVWSTFVLKDDWVACAVLEPVEQTRDFCVH